MKAIMAGGEKALVEIVNATHSGMTVESFTAEVQDWLAEARHPTSGRRYTDMFFQPLIELLAYLLANDFVVYILSVDRKHVVYGTRESVCVVIGGGIMRKKKTT